jgi:polyisoprenyl-teichoic acid--peptidoglycan teichoic acid transferase
MIDFKKKMEEIEKQEAKENFNEEFFDGIQPNKKKKRIIFYIITFIVITLIFSGKVIMSSQSTVDWLTEKGFFNTLKHLVPSSDRELIGENEDRINILLLGMGGEGHDGAYLTDTIIIASLKPSVKQAALISIPRDLVVPIEGNGWRKINHINALAEVQEEKSGGSKTMEALSSVFQIPIHYYIRADFQGFINIINEIGGIEIYVENTLDDYSYPIFGEEDNPNYYARFEHLHIEKGWQRMDGELALKYTRSRHAYGLEGSDFARAKRQQIVLEAIKNKLLSRQTLLNPVTISNLITEFNRHISTDLEAWEMIKLWNLFKNIKKEEVINQVLSDAPNGLLKSSISEEGAYILTPTSGNFGEIRKLFQNILENNDKKYNQEEENEKESSLEITLIEPANIIVKNGTWINGLASETASRLEKYDLTILDISNAQERDQQESIIFDLTYGNKNEALMALEEITGAEQNFAFPDWIKDYQNQEETVDFILLLGTDANNEN